MESQPQDPAPSSEPMKALSGAVPLAYLNLHSALVTALPYVDEKPSPAEMQVVKGMVSKELNNQQGIDQQETDSESYWEGHGLAEPKTPGLDRLLETLGKREQKSKEQPKNKPASSRDGDLKNYEQKAVEVEHMKDRLIHLKLIRKNLPALKAYKLNILAESKKTVEQALKTFDDKVKQLNTLRKYNQESVANKLDGRKVERQELSKKLNLLELKCLELRDSLEKKRRAIMKGSI